jgi:hypothetical protein
MIKYTSTQILVTLKSARHILEFWGNNFGAIDEAAGQATAKGRMCFF